MVLIAIVTGAYKPTYNWGPHIVEYLIIILYGSTNCPSKWARKSYPGHTEATAGSIVMNWLVVWNMIFFCHLLGISSSQLTNSYFQRGRYTTNQWTLHFHPLVNLLQSYGQFTINQTLINRLYHVIPFMFHMYSCRRCVRCYSGGLHQGHQARRPRQGTAKHGFCTERGCLEISQHVKHDENEVDENGGS